MSRPIAPIVLLSLIVGSSPLCAQGSGTLDQHTSDHLQQETSRTDPAHLDSLWTVEEGTAIKFQLRSAPRWSLGKVRKCGADVIEIRLTDGEAVTVAQSQIRRVLIRESVRFEYVGDGAGLGILAGSAVGGIKGYRAARGSQVRVEVCEPEQDTGLSDSSVFPDCFLAPTNEVERLGVEGVGEGGGDLWRFGTNVLRYTAIGVVAGAAIGAIIGAASGERWVDVERDAPISVSTGGEDRAISAYSRLTPSPPPGGIVRRSIAAGAMVGAVVGFSRGKSRYSLSYVDRLDAAFLGVPVGGFVGGLAGLLVARLHSSLTADLSTGPVVSVNVSYRF